MAEAHTTFGPGGWTPARLAAQDGKTFVITGANSGIGLEAAKLLASRGAHVVMACRDPAKAEAARAQVEKVRERQGRVILVPLDLADLESVRRAGAAVLEAAPSIDGLIANAGVMMPPTRQLTKQGSELQFGVNHLGHFLLTGLLLEAVERAQGRIAVVSSIAHKTAPRIQFDDVDFARRYSSIGAYSQSKLANMLFGLELERRLRHAGKPVTALTCHPGYSATNLQFSAPGPVSRAIYSVMNPLIAQSAERGAWPQVLCVAEPEAKGGYYYGPMRRMETGGPIGECQIAPAARDSMAAHQLWALSEQKTGFIWPL